MRLITLVMLCSSLLLPVTVKAEQCTLRMSAETDFPPHLIKQAEQWTGLSVELMQRLAKDVDCQLVFINSPWIRAIQMSEHGELDVLSHLSFSEQRKQQFTFIGPHHIEAIYLVGDPNKLPKAEALSQLAEDIDYGSIAVLHGAYYGEEFIALSKTPGFARQLVSISSIQDKLALLRAGRVNAILEDVSVVRYWQQNQYPDAERFQPLLKVYQSPVYFGFSKVSLSQEMREKLAQSWQKLHQQGELSSIYLKYHINNYAELIPASLL